MLIPDWGFGSIVAAVAIPILPLVLAGASFAGGLFSNKNKATSTTTPQLDPQFAGLQSIILPNIISRLQRQSALPAGLAERNIADINDVFKGEETHLENTLSARGLNTSPIAGNAFKNLGGRRASEIIRMKQSLPILDEELKRQDLMDALTTLQMGRGGSRTEQTRGGGRLAGGVSSLATMLGFLYGTGAFQRPTAQIPNMYTGF